ncbi:MAG: hypothetical protein ACYCZ6_16115 [Polaromonas sp.]
MKVLFLFVRPGDRRQLTRILSTSSSLFHSPVGKGLAVYPHAIRQILMVGANKFVHEAGQCAAFLMGVHGEQKKSR